MRRMEPVALDTDIGTWKQITSWLWTGVLPVLGWLGLRTVNAVSRVEMQQHLDDVTAARKEFRAEIKQLFDEAKEDRLRADQRFERMQSAIHTIHVELLHKLGDRK